VHPDLLQLQQHYNHVLDEYEAKNLSYDDAMATLAAMTAVDGAGWIWSIDAQTGSFVKARPGGEAEPAHESTFVPAQLDGLGQVSSSNTHLPKPPGGFVDLNQPPVIGRTPPATPPPTAWAPPTPPPTVTKENRSRRARAPREPRRTGGGAVPPDLTKLREALAGRGRTIGLVAAAVIVVFLLATSSGPATPHTSPSTQPSSLSGPAPTTAQVVQVLDGLVHGESVGSLVYASGSRAEARTFSAQYVGFHALGWYISTTTPRISGQSYTSTLRLFNKTTPLATARASWVLRGGAWELAAWPQWH